MANSEYFIEESVLEQLLQKGKFKKIQNDIFQFFEHFSYGLNLTGLIDAVNKLKAKGWNYNEIAYVLDLTNNVSQNNEYDPITKQRFLSIITDSMVHKKAFGNTDILTFFKPKTFWDKVEAWFHTDGAYIYGMSSDLIFSIAILDKYSKSDNVDYWEMLSQISKENVVYGVNAFAIIGRAIRLQEYYDVTQFEDSALLQYTLGIMLRSGIFFRDVNVYFDSLKDLKDVSHELNWVRQQRAINQAIEMIGDSPEVYKLKDLTRQLYLHKDEINDLPASQITIKETKPGSGLFIVKGTDDIERIIGEPIAITLRNGGKIAVDYQAAALNFYNTDYALSILGETFEPLKQKLGNLICVGYLGNNSLASFITDSSIDIVQKMVKIHEHTLMIARTNAYAPWILPASVINTSKRYYEKLETPGGNEPFTGYLNDDEIAYIRQNIGKIIYHNCASPFFSMTLDRTMYNAKITDSKLSLIDTDTILITNVGKEIARGVLFGHVADIQVYLLEMIAYAQENNRISESVNKSKFEDGYVQATLKARLQYLMEQENGMYALEAEEAAKVLFESSLAKSATAESYISEIKENVKADETFYNALSGIIGNADDFIFYALNYAIYDIAATLSMQIESDDNGKEPFVKSENDAFNAMRFGISAINVIENKYKSRFGDEKAWDELNNIRTVLENKLGHYVISNMPSIILN